MDKCRQELEVAKRYAESVAVITPELQQAFLEVCTLADMLCCTFLRSAFIECPDIFIFAGGGSKIPYLVL